MTMPNFRAATALSPFKSSKVSQLKDQQLERRKEDINDEDEDDDNEL